MASWLQKALRMVSEIRLPGFSLKLPTRDNTEDESLIYEPTQEEIERVRKAQLRFEKIKRESEEARKALWREIDRIFHLLIFLLGSSCGLIVGIWVAYKGFSGGLTKEDLPLFITDEEQHFALLCVFLGFLAVAGSIISIKRVLSMILFPDP